MYNDHVEISKSDAEKLTSQAHVEKSKDNKLDKTRPFEILSYFRQVNQLTPLIFNSQTFSLHLFFL